MYNATRKKMQPTDTSQEVGKLLITKEAYWSAQLFPLSPFGLIKDKSPIPKIAYIWHEYLRAVTSMRRR